MITPKVIKKSDSSVEFEVALDEAYIRPIKAHVFTHLKRDLKVSGFRPGKAPDHIVTRQLGDQKVQAEVIQNIIVQSYSEAVKSLQLETVAEPEVGLKKFVPFTQLEYWAKVSVMPEIKLPDLAKLKAKLEPVEVQDSEVERALKGLAQQAASRSPKTGAIAKGDEVKLNFEGVREGRPVEGAAAENQLLTIGEDRFIPGFEANLIGLKKGDEKEFAITFAKDYFSKDLAGKKVTFKVKILEVAKVTMPELNDALAPLVSHFKTLAQLKADIKANLAQNKQQEADKRYSDRVLDELAAVTKFEVPPALVSHQLKHLKAEVDKNLKNSGLDQKKYLELNNKQPADFDRELLTEATKRVTISLILRSVIKANNLAVSDSEVDGQLSAMRDRYSDPQVAKEINSLEFKDDLRNHLLSQKAIDFVINKTNKTKKTEQSK